MNTVPTQGATTPLCWICNQNPANSGEHKTKRSDLLAVLGKPSQQEPFFYSDLHKLNQPVKSLDAQILKAPIRICAYCNNTRTQPHDRAWEHLSDCLRNRSQPLKIGSFVRGNRPFPDYTRREMANVHRFFLKIFGCMLCEAGARVPIPIAAFSKAIMTSGVHPEVHLQFGKSDGKVGRSNLHCWTTQNGSVLAGWLYELDTIAVSVMYAQRGKWTPSPNNWHPHKGTNRFKIMDFCYQSQQTRTASATAANPLVTQSPASS